MLSRNVYMKFWIYTPILPKRKLFHYADTKYTSNSVNSVITAPTGLLRLVFWRLLRGSVFHHYKSKASVSKSYSWSRIHRSCKGFGVGGWRGHRVSLCGPDCFGTNSFDQAGLELSNLPDYTCLGLFFFFLPVVCVLLEIKPRACAYC